MNLVDIFKCLAESQQKFVLSCSGGVDSQVMLFLALKYLPTDSLVVVYFNHAKRVDIDYDIAAIKSLLLGCNVDLHVVDVDLSSTLAFYSRRLVTPLWDLNQVNIAHDSSFQALSSNFRHSYLSNLAKKLNAKVLIAHHADDQNENLLMKLSNDCSNIGFTTLKSGPVFLRPLINKNKSDLLACAHSNRLLFNEDSSNLSLVYTRNKFRNFLSNGLVSPLFLDSMFKQACVNDSNLACMQLESENLFVYEKGFFCVCLEKISRANLLYVFYCVFASVSRGRIMEFEKFIFDSRSSSEFHFNGVSAFKTSNSVFFTKLTDKQIVAELFSLDGLFLDDSSFVFANPNMSFVDLGKVYSYKNFFRKLKIPVFLRKYVPVLKVSEVEYKLYSKSLILSVYKNLINLA